MDNLERFVNLIPIGKENAIHQVHLAKLLGVSPEGAKQMVRVARQNGYEILSGSCGYYRAQNDEERLQFVKLFSKQAYTRLNTTRLIRHTLSQINGQISLSDALNSVPEEAEDEQE